MQTHSLFCTRLALLGLIAIATSCGGGGGNSTLTNVANEGLTGRIITTVRGIPMQVVLSTGAVNTVPVETIQDFLLQHDLKPDKKEAYFTMAGKFGSEGSPRYVQTVNSCVLGEEYHGGLLKIFDSCVYVYDEAYNKLQSIIYEGRQLGYSAKLSSDGKLLAFNDFYSESCCYASRLIMDRFSSSLETGFHDYVNLSVEDSFVEGGGRRYTQTNESPLDWTRNNELVYSVPSDVRVVVYVTEPNSLEVARTITLPAYYQGEIKSLDVSPDGTKVLIGYNPKQGPYVGGVLLLNLVTLELTVPAIVPSEQGIEPLGDDIEGYIRAPRWSPDGQWIMLIEGHSNITLTHQYDISGQFTTQQRMFAVPASQSRTIVSAGVQSEAILIRMQSLLAPEGIQDAWFGDDYVYPHYDWVE